MITASSFGNGKCRKFKKLGRFRGRFFATGTFFLNFRLGTAARAVGRARRARAFRRPPPDPVASSRIFQREKRLSGRAARSQKRSSKRGSDDSRLRLRRGAPPRGRGGRRGGAGTEGTSSYRIVAERARLRVFPIARSRASAEPITVSRVAASARASTCDNEHGRASPLGASWLRRRFFPLPGRSLPFPLVAVRNPRPAPD